MASPTAPARGPSCHHDYYNERWQSDFVKDTLPIDDQRARRILAMLARWSKEASTRGARPKILDVGCGVGWISQLLTAHGEVTAIDSSDAGLAVARQRYPGARYVCGDVLRRDARMALGTFDILVCSEVIEHVPYPAQADFVAALHELLKPGGVCLLTTPNGLAADRYWETPSHWSYRQPVEDWRRPRELRQLFAPRFRCLEMSTYDFAFSRRGIYRVFHSWKLGALTRALGLDGLFDRVKAWRWGLYIAAAFQARD